MKQDINILLFTSWYLHRNMIDQRGKTMFLLQSIKDLGEHFFFIYLTFK